MISVQLARRLRDAGLHWRPAAGDRFAVDDPEMDGEVFVISDMTVNVHNLPGGQVIGFNGTTEWALDSVDGAAAVWLPRESQLREALAAAFTGLDRVATGWRVCTEHGGHRHEHVDPDAETAYGLSVAALLDSLR